MTSGLGTTAKYSDSESAKKANVMIPIENKYQDSEGNDSEEELEPKFFYDSRGKQILNTSGGDTKRKDRSSKKVKTAENQGDGEKEGELEGESAKEGAQNGK